MSPGGSIKDRAALYLVKDAEERGQLRPGGTVVEGTAGNTGIGLAHVCRARGYKCVIYMPDTQSQEKIDLLRMLGADVRPVPAVAFDNDMNYNHQARRYAESLDNAVWTNQFDNVANRNAHIVSTGPEIWEQTGGGKLDAFVAATGTGGTLAGITRYLVEKSEGRVESYLADPPGSVLYNLVENGRLEREGTGSITEGIGQGRVTENLKPDLELLSGAVHVPDAESIKMIYRLLDEEGLYVGASSALNVWAATQVAKKKGPGSTVVTVIGELTSVALFGGTTFLHQLFHLPLSFLSSTSPTPPACIKLTVTSRRRLSLSGAPVLARLARIEGPLQRFAGKPAQVRRSSMSDQKRPQPQPPSHLRSTWVSDGHRLPNVAQCRERGRERLPQRLGPSSPPCGINITLC